MFSGGYFIARTNGSYNGFKQDLFFSGNFLYFKPPPCHLDNHKQAYANADFVSASISDLLQASAIELWPVQPRCVHPLNVATRSNGKKRLILDLRHVNQFLSLPRFHMECLQYLTDIADLDDYMYSLDLASGYHQVDMDSNSFQYLGFQWQGSFYVFKVLPVGLSIAPWCFSKIMRVVARHLRFQSLRLILYLDDFLFLSKLNMFSHEQSLVLDTFRAAGLSINAAKSHLQPVRRLTHLGFVIDLETGLFEVPHECWDTLQSLIKSALSSNTISEHLLEQICGHISSMLLAFGSHALMYIRACHRLKETTSALVLNISLCSLLSQPTFPTSLTPTTILILAAWNVGNFWYFIPLFYHPSHLNAFQFPSDYLCAGPSLTSSSILVSDVSLVLVKVS